MYMNISYWSCFPYFLGLASPSYRNQSVAAFKATFVPIKELVTQLNELLTNDGYAGGLSTVSLDAQSTLVLFSSDEELMQRARFWLQQLADQNNS